MSDGRPLRCVVVASTGGSVMNELLRQPTFRAHVHSVVVDRACGAAAKARAHGVPVTVIEEPRAAGFCERLDAYLRAHAVDYVIAFFTRLFVGPLLERWRHRILNLHPSLLPSFKGLHGFEDALRAGVRVTGSTIHFVDADVDAGPILIQTVAPVDPARPAAELRHRLFEQQCRSLLQVVRWLADGRVAVQGSTVVVHGATYGDCEFSPALDDRAALALRVPPPVAAAEAAR